jgi:hypothetical protein
MQLKLPTPSKKIWNQSASRICITRLPTHMTSALPSSSNLDGLTLEVFGVTINRPDDLDASAYLYVYLFLLFHYCWFFFFFTRFASLSWSLVLLHFLFIHHPSPSCFFYIFLRNTFHSGGFPLCTSSYTILHVASVLASISIHLSLDPIRIVEPQNQY